MSEIDTTDPADAFCPVTGLPVARRKEWTDVRLDDGYWVTVEVIGGHIVRSRPRGYATRDGVVKVNALHHDALREAVAPGAVHIHIADYTEFHGATPEARKAFANDVAAREGLAALIFHNVSPLFNLSIRLGRRFLGLHMPVEIHSDYASAIRRALHILEEEGVADLPREVGSTTARRQPESGGMDLERYQVQYRVVDGHIVHGAARGHIGLREMERHLEFENMVVSSLDRSRGNPAFVVDISALKGISAAARRLYVASLRNRQRVNPIALYVCYGVNNVIRNAINISRPLLPFRIRIARDEETAFEIARSNAEKPSGPVSRIRSLILRQPTKEQLDRQARLDDLLRMLTNIDWEHDGPVESDWDHPPDHPLSPVNEALQLIKADVDELFRARRKTEQALRESEERYRGILESIVDGYYEIDFNGNLLAFNDALLRIFGFDRSDVADIDARSLVTEENLKTATKAFERVYDSREPAHTSGLEMQRKDGSTIIVEASISLVNDREDRPIGFRGIIRDVTERVRTQREKADLEVQLQRSQRLEAIGTLAGGIAHNFNNLLMGVQGNISLLARDLPHDGPEVKRLATIEALVNGGSKLTSQLLGYARSGRVEVRVVDLNALILETAETFSLTRREYRVHTGLSDRVLPIEVDPAQIEQALLNLLINAADAMPRGGDIFIASRMVPHTMVDGSDPDVKPGDHALVSIRDTGCGMDGDTIEHIFEPFFTTKGMSGGTGLGLASTYGIIRAHGGQIGVASAVGEGSTFTLAFPISIRRPESAGATREPPIEGEGTILVVEDDDAVLDACASMLSLLNYTPICVTSGQDAVDVFEARKDEIDLIVLDLILSDISGAEVFDRVRAIEPSVRVLLSSGYSLEGEAAGLLERGCNDFIQKPFTMEQLSVKLENLLGRPD